MSKTSPASPSADDMPPKTLVDRPYRTIVFGTLKQMSGLSVGGGASEDGAACYRDGDGRFVLPGTGLAGLLVESASRVCPQVIDDEGTFGVTGKSSGLHAQGSRKDEELRASVWKMHSAFCLETPTTYWQQGVGIEQRTRTSAADNNALFELEMIPAGTKWGFLLEIDTQSSPLAEWLTIVSLRQWRGGWVTFGRSPTRGNGRLELVDVDVYPLPSDKFDCWPDNSIDLTSPDGIRKARRILGQACHSFPLDECFESYADPEKACQGAIRVEPWIYARIVFDLCYGAGSAPYNGEDNECYGLNTLTSSGHASLEHVDVATYPNHIPSSARSAADAPFPAVIRRRDNGQEWNPTLPGGSVRGVMRHVASALARGKGKDVPDPNDGRARTAPDNDDPITALFGWPPSPDEDAPKSSRLMCWDVEIEDPLIVRTEHHAEDEFTAGTFAGAKFNRDSVLSGRSRVVFQLEAANKHELLQYLQTLLPTIRYAQLGFISLGGKRSVSGHTRWRLDAQETRCVDALGRKQPGLLDEINGVIAVGANVPPHDDRGESNFD